LNTIESAISKPLISVLLPFYNAGELISRAIQSIINQTFVSWELILVNNGSTDCSVKLAECAAKADSRIKIINESCKDIVNALNTGLLQCKGEYIARMDADDESLPNRLSWQFNFMNLNPEIDLSSGLVKHVSNNGESRGYKIYVDWINSLITNEQIHLNQFIESPFAHPSVVFTKKALQKYGGYSEGDFPEDYEMWLRWLNMGAKCQKIEKEILIWNDFPTRLSRTDERYKADAFNSIKIQYLDKWLKKYNPFFPEIAIWGAGKIGRKNALLLEKLGHKIIFFIDVSLKKIIHNNCMMYTDIPKAGDCFIVNFVGNRGAAPLIKKELVSKGYIEGKSFIMAAGIK